MADATMARSSQDEAVVQAAEQALVNYSGVRVWTDALDLKSTNGILEISGHVRTHSELEVTENVLLSTKGVSDVISHLYVDTDIEIAVAKALGKDSRTRGSFPGILVGSAFGDVYLKGSVTSADIKKAAAEIATKIEGVRSVINSLEVVEATKPAAAGAAAPGATVAKPAVAGAKPVVAVKPPAAGAVKPSVTPMKPPAAGAVKPGITPMKPPAPGSVKSSITPMKPPAPGSVKSSVAKPPAKPAEEKTETPPEE